MAAASTMAQDPPLAEAPLLSGMGTYALPRASRSAEAQRYFRQGMTLTWGFNPQEGVRAFRTAAKIDPACALCWWGVAWAQGPNINSDMAPGASESIADALARGQVAAGRDPSRARLLLGALARRHPLGGLDEEGYADAMRELATRFPKDADMAALAAEAVLDLHPYDWWDARGEPKPWTREIESLLSRALQLQPDHPGANHYRVHLLEGSAHPERGLPNAMRLASIAPGSGHLVHMPAHIYMRLGRYGDAVAASEQSIAADARYEAEIRAAKAYRVGYVAHNQHFLWAAAAMQGRSEVAVRAARATYAAACGPTGADRGTALLQQYYVLPLFALVRFGRWHEILGETLPPDVAEPYPNAIWHYARGTAFTRTGDVSRARSELRMLRESAASPALAALKIKNLNAASALVRIATLTLEADIEMAEGRVEGALPLLRQATAVEDGLQDDEPHLWLAPTRHALGNALSSSRRYDEAERVFREDLVRYPENGWALFGLAEALRMQGRRPEAALVDASFARAWRAADIALSSARF